MLCDDCYWRVYYAGSSNPDIGMPYPEHYCAKDHWSGIDPDEFGQESDVDPWADCPDFRSNNHANDPTPKE